MSLRKYILNDKGNPVIEPDLYKWVGWFEKTKHLSVVDEKIGHYRISTIFLGLDQGYGKGPPIVWETMVFHDDKKANAPLDREQDRCSGSREQAEAMHQRMTEKVMMAMKAK